MNRQQLIDRYGRRQFKCEGLFRERAYMVVNEAIMYIRAEDIEIAEGQNLEDMQSLIQDVFSVPER